MTLQVFNNAANVIFMAGGVEKAAVLRDVLEDPGEPQFPAAMIQPGNGRLLWMIDEAAARLLTNKS
jgi:6-phosphogluconolactonase